MYLSLTKLNEGYEDTMFVRNVVKDERQHECSMHIIVRVGIDSPMIDTIGLTEW